MNKNSNYFTHPQIYLTKIHFPFIGFNGSSERIFSGSVMKDLVKKVGLTPQLVQDYLIILYPAQIWENFELAESLSDFGNTLD